MGGAGSKVRQAGRWFDSDVLQSRAAGVISPFALGYQAYSGTGFFKPPKGPSLPSPPPPGPDGSDRALLAAKERELQRLKGGGRRNSFIGGSASMGAPGAVQKIGGY